MGYKILKGAMVGILLGVCGAGVFSSSRAGAALYLIHVAAALCAGRLPAESAATAAQAP